MAEEKVLALLVEDCRQPFDVGDHETQDEFLLMLEHLPIGHLWHLVEVNAADGAVLACALSG